jgi:hypothetical protein
MKYSRVIAVTMASLATWAPAATLSAEEAGSFMDYASLQPESRAALERIRRPMTYAQIAGRDRTRREEKPLVDFAFAFSRAVTEGDHSNLAGNFARTHQGTTAKSMQHQDILIAELEARESQIASDMKAEAVVEDPAPVQGRITVPARGPAPVKLDPTWLEVAPPGEPQKGWSGMTLAVQDVALRFVDEGGAAPVQFR